MILGIDVGNTSIELALMGKNGDVLHKKRMDTIKSETADYYKSMIASFSAEEQTDGVVISSVVPEINPSLEQACTQLFGNQPLFISSRLKTNLKIKYDHPERLGADLIAVGAGAVLKYNAPVIVVDIGTATTFSVVNEKNEYLGGMIAPGPHTAMKALSENASQLSETDMHAIDKVIGTNTADCMKIGTLTAHAAMIDGMISRVKKSLCVSDICVIATGGFAEPVTAMCENEIICDENLIFTGMFEIYKLNTKQKQLF